MALCGLVFSKNTNGSFDQEQGWPALTKTLPANERKALLWYKWLGLMAMAFAICGHAVFMSVAHFLVMLWSPYQQAFIVTNWITDILQHSILAFWR
jgi:hypothetical protein